MTRCRAGCRACESGIDSSRAGWGRASAGPAGRVRQPGTASPRVGQLVALSPWLPPAMRWPWLRGRWPTARWARSGLPLPRSTWPEPDRLDRGRHAARRTRPRAPQPRPAHRSPPSWPDAAVAIAWPAVAGAATRPYGPAAPTESRPALAERGLPDPVPHPGRPDRPIGQAALTERPAAAGRHRPRRISGSPHGPLPDRPARRGWEPARSWGRGRDRRPVGPRPAGDSGRHRAATERGNRKPARARRRWPQPRWGSPG